MIANVRLNVVYCINIKATNVKVLGVNLAVLGLVEVLLGDENTLAEEVLVDRLAVGLGNQPGGNIRICCMT